MPKTILRRLRPLLPTLAVFAGVALIAVVVAIAGNTFRYAQQSVEIAGPSGRLVGVVTLPTEGNPRGVVVMVHGDGAVNATRDGLYAPWFEAAADAGFATVSWSKPGVGGSAGNWLGQSMDDRGREVEAVLDWVRTRDDLRAKPVVLWGASQAGWVLPAVAGTRTDVNAVVAVGTAVDWLRQGRYNLLADLDHDDATAQQRREAIEASDRTRALLERGASYEDYLAVTPGDDAMSIDQWGFVQRNLHSDATASLAALGGRGIPVHLMIGRHDRNVDVDETERVYRDALGPALTVSRFDGAHSLARPVMEDSEALGLVTGVMWPRALLAPGVLEDYRSFLASRVAGTPVP